VHYLRHGASEGRPPTCKAQQIDRTDELALLAQSDLIDRSWYLEQYPDIRETGVDPVLHYLDQGASEGRSPSELFDTKWYLTHYPDVATTGLNPLVHFLLHGMSEGRRCNNRAQQAESSHEMKMIESLGLFDREWYLRRYPDVRAAGID